MSSLKVGKRLLLLVSCLFYTSCSAIINKSLIPKIDKVTQTKTSEINLIVNKDNKADIKTSILLNNDISSVDSNVSISRVDGDNINDLSITGEKKDCFKNNGEAKGFVCTFDFSVVAKDNWEAKNVVRVINSITYKIYDTEIVSPVSIKVYEGVDGVELMNSSLLFTTPDYKTLTFQSNKYEGNLISLNWNRYIDYGSDLGDDNKVHIKKLFFHFDYLKINSASIGISNLNGEEVNPPRYDKFEIPEFDYVLTKKQMEYSDNYLKLDIEINKEKTSYKQVSDFVEMHYSLNDSTEIKKVFLFTAQLCDFIY